MQGRNEKILRLSLEHFVGHLAEEIGLGFVSGVPVLRDLAGAAVNGRSYSATPLDQAGQTLVQTARDAYHGATGKPVSKHPVQNAAKAAGYVFGLPTGQASSSGRFLWDVYQGNADPQGLRDWWAGLETGRMPAK